MALKQRELAMLVVLSIVTCGIYSIYWLVTTTDDIEATIQNKDGSVSKGLTCFLLGIITCGIYTIYWYYKQGERLHQIGKERGVEITNNSTLLVILAIFTAGVVAEVFLQMDINKIINANPQN